MLFPHTFHENNFWELTVPVKLKEGDNTVRFSSGELPNFDGETYASGTFPGVPLRSQYAPGDRPDRDRASQPLTTSVLRFSATS
ncbi:hypothetical protein ABGB18_28900 [Nonomuraea sp. B12E4]|uniref:hypothetical protein n=1 Tax=Nonomuraea sp. B12E4 TaxID=3153564 RepID=UPI00325E282F